MSETQPAIILIGVPDLIPHGSAFRLACGDCSRSYPVAESTRTAVGELTQQGAEHFVVCYRCYQKGQAIVNAVRAATGKPPAQVEIGGMSSLRKRGGDKR